MSNFADRLDELMERATKGPWYEAGCNTVHGGDHEEIAHPFNLDSTDGALIVYLRNHAPAILDLVRAAEELVDWKLEDESAAPCYNRDVAIFRKALAKLEEA